MEDAPDVPGTGLSLDYLVCEGLRPHVEVTESNDEMTTLASMAHEFRYLPSLSSSVAEMDVMGFRLVWRVKLCIHLSSAAAGFDTQLIVATASLL